ncbi:hypothetical protein [Paracidovorax sp. MALMAid1276]|uniref:hypothetical protein n=1 Tax=Paracidovorax sp. MALMAid1276 TaxID=3411631 RepID=UPI003B992E7A
MVRNVFSGGLLRARWSMVCAVVLGIAAWIAPAQSWAQATRTWVSGVGDDANPCSRTAPCKTFAGAISKTAAGGEISVLDPGGYGSVTITKAITIDGGGGIVASILASGTTGVIVNAGATDNVVLRNLTINGAGPTLGTHGVRVNSGRSLRLQNVRVDNFSGAGLLVVPNASSPSATVLVEVLDSALSNNGHGVFVASQPGGNNPASVSVERSRMIFNQVSGITSTGSGAVVQVANSTVFGNALGLSTAVETTDGTPQKPVTTTSTGNLTSFGNNQVQGNTTNGVFTGTASNR